VVEGRELQHASGFAPLQLTLFNFTFARQDDVVKLGFTVDLSLTAPPYRTSVPSWRGQVD
jgi:hypothetical protein